MALTALQEHGVPSNHEEWMVYWKYVECMDRLPDSHTPPVHYTTLVAAVVITAVD